MCCHDDDDLMVWLGRAIRHGNDWASLVLLDRRYGAPSIRNKLPKWIGSKLVVTEGFGQTVKEMGVFYRSKKPWAIIGLWEASWKGLEPQPLYWRRKEDQDNTDDYVGNKDSNHVITLINLPKRGILKIILNHAPPKTITLAWRYGFLLIQKGRGQRRVPSNCRSRWWR